MATAEASCILLDEELWRLASMMDKPRSRDGYYGKPLPITQAPTAPFAIFSALNSLGQRISPAGFRASSQACKLPLSKKNFTGGSWPEREETFGCSDGGGRTSLTECTQQHIPGTSRSRSHFLSCTVCGAVRFLCRASPCCSAMHLATQCLACCSVREDYTLGSGCSCTYQDPRLFRLVQSVYFITPVVAGVWIMGQVTEGGAWHQGAAGDFHSVFARCRPHKLP